MNPSVVLSLRFRAAPFEEWSRLLEKVVETSVRHGGLGHRVMRSFEDPRDYLVEFEFTSLGGAERFAEAEPALLRTWALIGADPHHREWPAAYFEEISAARYDAFASDPV